MKEDSTHSWIIVSCRCGLAEEETCSWLFFQNEAIGLEIENLDDGKIDLKASFSISDLLPENLSDLQQEFKKAGLAEVAKTLKSETIADQNWMSNWKKYFTPFTVGNSLHIGPPWQTDEPIAEEFQKRKKILIDPGMAFGTGLHATTKYCLQAIEKWAKGPNILDVGTGSGILAIASVLLLPASHVVALDTDDNAIANAKENISLNHAEKYIELKQASPGTLNDSVQFNTILSNLTVESIIDLLPIYNKLLASEGVLILAGIIEERLSLLESALLQYQWQRLEQINYKGWIGLALRRPNS